MSSLIAVGVDGSPDAERALRWAVSWAERTGGSIRAVMAWDYPALAVMPPPLGMPIPPEEHMVDATRSALAKSVQPIRSTSGVEITEVVRRGPAAQALLDEAENASLLVVGTRGRGRLAAVLLGSVSRKVAAAAPCPVAVIPDVDGLTLDHPVVVGVDGSAGSLAALRWAGEAIDGPIEALHIFEYPFGPEYAVDGFEWDDPQELGEKLLERSVEEALGDRPGVTRSAVKGEPRQVLIEAGQRASMIVVGARGLTGLAGVLGSITTAVASAAPVPVVVVPDR